MGEEGNAYRILVRKPERKKPLERNRRRWENNIKMDWTDLAKDGTTGAIANTVMNLRVP
jgi:hypothetical protein